MNRKIEFLGSVRRCAVLLGLIATMSLSLLAQTGAVATLKVRPSVLEIVAGLFPERVTRIAALALAYPAPGIKPVPLR